MNKIKFWFAAGIITQTISVIVYVVSALVQLPFVALIAGFWFGLGLAMEFVGLKQMTEDVDKLDRAEEKNEEEEQK